MTRPLFHEVLAQIDGVVLGKARQTRLALTCLLAGGHLLIEDLPGVGKTTLAHALAHSLGLEFKRIQFTSDLLPADVLGYSVFDRAKGGFSFHPGPIFSQVVLADEINRATPKSQSALLEAMEEGQVTLEGTTRPLPYPFFVIATQNPFSQTGVYPLPESQLDRFLMRLTLGYPDSAAERDLLSGRVRAAKTYTPAASPQDLLEAREALDRVHLSAPLLDYLQALATHSRAGRFVHGLSPRAMLGLARAARSWAWLESRDFVIPDDVQAVFSAVAAHRLLDAEGGLTGEQCATAVLEAVAIP
ncbi:MAG TPA: MoxR family ATPase [Thiobacillaceae bacterium]|nr:MoxR family ATPase [Thiobacillaceae bacterium]HNU63514.1 MoxR family ATPase [Thiobacillaceae bacterium]